MRLDFLRPLYEDGATEVVADYASVYLDTPLAGETTTDERTLRWRTARRALAGDGADEKTLQALAEVVADPGHAAPGLAAFARAGSVVLSSALAAAPPREITRYSRLPHVMPLLAQMPPRIPHLLVTADKSGGEIVSAWGEGQQAEATVAGEGWPVHKARVGGWSQARYQRAAEEAWSENAKELAAAVTATAARVHAELIVVAGDVRARQLLVEHLGQPLRDQVITVDREVPADSEVLAEVARDEFARLADDATRAGLDSLRSRLPRGQAAEGLADTVTALSNGLVSELFLSDEAFADDGAGGADALWIGPDPAALAVSVTALRERGVAEPVAERADAALVRALTMTGAELRLVPPDADAPREGIGALLRYAAST
jgi:Bacterial archaeo-eukaryotic release factor family 2